MLDSNYSVNGHIVVEGSDLSHNLISFEYTDQIFEKEECQIDFNVEVFVDLGSPPIPSTSGGTEGQVGRKENNYGMQESGARVELPKDAALDS